MADYSETKNRLEEIKDTIKDNKLSLDESLDLYEEAVKLGLEASNNVEQVLAQEEAEGNGDSVDQNSSETNDESNSNSSTESDDEFNSNNSSESDDESNSQNKPDDDDSNKELDGQEA